MHTNFLANANIYDNIISTTLAEMSDLSFLWKLRKTLVTEKDDRKVQNLNCDESYVLSATRDLLQIAQGQIQQSTTTFIITRFHCTATASIQDTNRAIQAD